MKPDVLAILQELRFTEYEAKAYLALLEKAPLSGYAVSLNSGVPRSKIYEVLNGMVARGDVLVSQQDTPLYVPLAPDELLAQRKRRAEEVFHEAGVALEQYAASVHQRDGIWNITGREAILSRVAECIGGAHHRVLIEIWREDAQALEATLRAAAARGVEVTVVAYGPLEWDFATVYRHDMDREITAEYGGRWLVFSVDDREIVAGILSLGEDSRAAWTTHPGLVMPITEVIVHDLYIMEIMRAFRPQLEARFGADLADLRRRFVIASLGKRYGGVPDA